jgi:hypothetical protein
MTVKSVNLTFPASPSPDVTGYKLFMEEAPGQVTPQSQSWDLGNVTTVDLSTLCRD